MNKPRLGFAMCASHCCFEKVLSEAESLSEAFDLVPIMSERAANTDTRFGRAEDFRARLEKICGRSVICDIKSAEPLGPSEPLDALVIAPCTGNTLAKLCSGITDSAVLMAAKAHLRNARPLIIAFSTNDGLTGSLPNIAGLLSRKSIYFVPFGQDDHVKKPNSLASDWSLIGRTVELAMKGVQLQPIIVDRA